MLKKTIVIFLLIFNMVLLNGCGSKKLDYIYYTDGNENANEVMYTKNIVSKEFLNDYYFKRLFYNSLLKCLM